MYALIVIAAAAFFAWRLEFWPFDRSYSFLPKYEGKNPQNPTATTGPKRPM
jgi:hypothetical protein